MTFIPTVNAVRRNPRTCRQSWDMNQLKNVRHRVIRGDLDSTCIGKKLLKSERYKESWKEGTRTKTQMTPEKRAKKKMQRRKPPPLSTAARRRRPRLPGPRSIGSRARFAI